MRLRHGVHGLTTLAILGCFSDPPDVGPSDSAGTATSTSATTTTPPPTTVEPTDPSDSSDSLLTFGTTMFLPTTTFEPTTTFPATTGGSTLGTGPRPCRPLVVEFGAIELAGGAEDAAHDGITSLPQLEGSWDAYDGTDQDQIVNRVTALLSPYPVCVATEPPPAAAYDMVFVSSTTQPFLGIAALDCEDDAFIGGVGGVFPPSVSVSSRVIGDAIVREYALGLGLELVDGNGTNELMGSPAFNGETEFRDECFTVTSPSCPPDECGNGEQNSLARLAAVLASAP